MSKHAKQTHMFGYEPDVPHLKQQVEQLTIAIQDLLPDAYDCPVCGGRTGVKSGVTICSADSIATMYFCPDCREVYAFTILFDQKGIYLHQLDSDQVKTVKKACRAGQHWQMVRLINEMLHNRNAGKN